MSEESIEELLSDLYEVGISKSLGYLPLDTLTNKCNKSIQDMIIFAENNGLKYIAYNKGECSVGSGAIFIYHEKWLMEILLSNKVVLSDAKVPYDNAIDYINCINNRLIPRENYPKAYEVIGKTFNDFRFR